MQIGFIGTGVMGNAIAVNLLKAGHTLTVFNRTKSKTDNLVNLGATWADSPKLVAQKSDLVFTMVGMPTDVENVYFNDDGIFAGLTANKTVVDLTTSRPDLAKKIYSYAKSHAIFALDAPVSGGDIGAKNATLTIMVGGELSVFNQIEAIFKEIGQTVNYFGPAGSGQHTKMANQIMIAGTMTGLTEMLLYAKAANLDLNKVLATVGGGSAANWSLSNYGPRILKDDYTPGFFARHFLKDLRIALDEADKMNLTLPATTEAKRLYEVMVDECHLGDQGTQGLINSYK
ncbi:NAD(P)-dependent oxidoreductase [Ligilactobacillus sp. WILCCON 0076]|uniref:NAD(P)-dependent oxidoreductase n=1 Tax=Ligilactobacillus ubinensis TaxID=2876789 RepID=A0A9X2FJT5_9LACO|nr:NAD(P)-dependent oxidoreductase [Ligilactobacillus ubinensis]MCP0885848.1 NAD(P)-dependent oxidoreductase [Ligilactobacillus ubinensis]